MVSQKEECIISIIQRNLSEHQYNNATFLSERLCDISKTEINYNYLAKSYHGNGKHYCVESILRNQSSLDNRYLYALSCYELGKLTEAENALLRSTPFHRMPSDKLKREITSSTLHFIPHGAAGLHLLGKLAIKGNKAKLAITYFKLSIKFDCFMFEAFEMLTKLGANADAATEQELGFSFTNDNLALRKDLLTYTLSSSANKNAIKVVQQQQQQHEQQLQTATMNNISGITPLITNLNLSSLPPHPPSLFSPDHKSRGSSVNRGLNFYDTTPSTSSSRPVILAEDSITATTTTTTAAAATATSSMVTPVATSTSYNVTRRRSVRIAKRKKAQLDMGHKTSSSSSSSSSNNLVLNTTLSTPITGVVTTANSGRRNSNIENLNNNVLHENANGNTATNTINGHLSYSNIEIQDLVDTQVKSHGGQQEVLGMLSQLSKGIWYLNYYHCKDALDVFESLPACHFNSGWAQHGIGKAYFENSQYNKSKEAFQRMRKLEPHRLAGLEIYSAALWKLKDRVELTFLSQSCVELDRMSPQTWCVVGQCFSLLKDHEAAISFFERAYQVDPMFTYAYTLAGLEYYENDQFDKAAESFRHAIRLDDRHYNAWSGLANVYFREEKYHIAGYHFNYALSLNPYSKVINTFLGQVQYRMGNWSGALETFAEVIKEDVCPSHELHQHDPSKSMAMYHHALVLNELERYEEAYKELNQILEKCPQEPAAHILLGRVCKKLNKMQKSFYHFNAALDLDLDPKNSNDVKIAMEKLHNLSDTEEEEF